MSLLSVAISLMARPAAPIAGRKPARMPWAARPATRFNGTWVMMTSAASSSATVTTIAPALPMSRRSGAPKTPPSQPPSSFTES